MSSNKRLLKLSNIKQLIDLNEDKINFHIDFMISSTSKTPFDALVVTQDMLDSESELNYQTAADGVISGKITSDKNVYQSYFLLLKSSEPNECELVINLTEISPNLVSPVEIDQSQDGESRRPLKIKKSGHHKSDINWSQIALIISVTILVGLMGYLVYCYLFDKKELMVEDVQKELNTKLDGQIEDINNKLTNSLGNIEQKINTELSDGLSNINNVVDGKISNKMTEIEGKFSKLPDVLDEVVSNKINQIKLDDKISDGLSKINHNVEVKVDDTLSNFSKDIADQLSGLSQKVSNLTVDNNRGNETNDGGKISLKKRLEKL